MVGGSSLREPNVASFDQSGRLRSLHAHWRAQARGNLPGPAIVDPIALRPWLGHLLLVDVVGNGEFKYRVYGTAVAETFGEDMTGRSPGGFPPHHVEIIVGPYRAVAEDAKPRYTAHILAIRERKFAVWERIVLPIAGASARVEQLLVGIHRVRVSDFARYRASLDAAGIVPAITSEPEGAFL
jgi:hypothetical protein